MVSFSVNWQTKTRQMAMALSAVALPLAVSAARLRTRKASCARRACTSIPGSPRSIRPCAARQSRGGDARQSGIAPAPVSALPPSRERLDGVGVTTLREAGDQGRRRQYVDHEDPGPAYRMRRISGYCVSARRSFPTRATRTVSIRFANTPTAVPTANVSIVPLSRPAAATAPRARRTNGGARNNAQAAIDLNAVRNEFVAEIEGAMSPAQADELARRHGLERLASQEFPLLGGSTIGLFRIIDGRPPDMVRREFAADAAGGVKSVQLNFRYRLQDRKRRSPRATSRNMRSPSFDCRRPMRSRAA